MIADRYVQYMVAYRDSHDTLENSIAGEHFTAQKATDVGYSAGDFVVYNDEFYRCKQSYKSYILPTNTSYWEKLVICNYFTHFIELTGTLTAGSTTLTISDASITTTSVIDYYTDIFGVNPTNAVVSNGSIVLTFDAQQSDLHVKVRVS